jgi:PAS domain S-box-containing protein
MPLRIRPFSPRLQKIPLRWLLVGTFVVQTAAAIGLVTWVSLRNRDEAVHNIAQNWQRETLQRIEIQLQDYLNVPNLINETNAQSLKIGELDINRPEAFTRRFWHQKKLFQTDSVSAIYLGSPTGNFVGLGFQQDSITRQPKPQNGWQISRVDSNTNRQFYSYAVKSDGTPGALLQRGRPYDPRTRPWYQVAVQAQQPIWTDIYPDFKEARLKLTRAQPVYDANRQLIGVVGTDFVLSHLGDILRSLNPSENGQIYILDRSGKIVATSAPWQGPPLERVGAMDAQDAVTRLSAEKLTASLPSLATLGERRFLTTHFRNQRYFLQITPFNPQKGIDWVIIVAVPEHYFLESIQENNRVTVLLCILILLIAVLVGLLTSSAMGRAVERFINASQAIADGNLDQMLPDSQVQEVSALSHMFNRMTQQLQHAFDDLEALVQARAAALQQSEEKFSKLFYCHPTPISISRLEDGVFVDINDSALQLVGFERDEVLGQTVADLKVGPTMEERNGALQTLREVGSFRDRESTLFTKTGEKKTILYSADVIQLGEEWFLISSFSDISDRKCAEEALKVAKAQAETANRAKSQFLSTMSHELRTPLNAILGFSQLLSRDRTLSKRQHESLEIINRSGEHLLILINDVLDMAKIEAGRQVLHLTSFDLHELLQSLEALFQLKSQSKGIQLQFERSPTVPQYIKTDETKLRQILQNLLSNALKFTQAGVVTLRVVLTPESHAIADAEHINDSESEEGSYPLLWFEVQDTGCGIASQELNSIFEPFVQTESGRNSQTGTGLGLPISKKFVELMGGSISADSAPQMGTTFKFSIQFTPPTEQEILQLKGDQSPQRVLRLGPGQPAYRILIAEDQWENRQLLSTLLNNVGFEIREVTNGQEALHVYQDWQPHLIWMDMKMPLMDGYTATRLIKQRIQTQQSSPTIIIALTASALDEDRETILATGCDDIVRKPFQEAIIFKTIQQYLQVEYVYDTAHSDLEPASLANSELTVAELGTMPLDWIQQLNQAATRANNSEILALVKQIPAHNPEIADKINLIVHNFRCDKLLTLTETVLNEHRIQSAL